MSAPKLPPMPPGTVLVKGAIHIPLFTADEPPVHRPNRHAADNARALAAAVAALPPPAPPAPKATPAGPAPQRGDAGKLEALANVLGVASGDLDAMTEAFNELVGPRIDAARRLTPRQLERCRRMRVDPLVFAHANKIGV